MFHVMFGLRVAGAIIAIIAVIIMAVAAVACRLLGINWLLCCEGVGLICWALLFGQVCLCWGYVIEVKP